MLVISALARWSITARSSHAATTSAKRWTASISGRAHAWRSELTILTIASVAVASATASIAVHRRSASVALRWRALLQLLLVAIVDWTARATTWTISSSSVRWSLTVLFWVARTLALNSVVLPGGSSVTGRAVLTRLLLTIALGRLLQLLLAIVLLRVAAFFIVRLITLASRCAIVAAATILLLVRGVLGAGDRATVRSGHIGRLEALLTLDDVEFDPFILTQAALRLARIVLGDRGLVNEHVLVVVVTVDETVAVLDVEPLDNASYLGDYQEEKNVY